MPPKLDPNKPIPQVSPHGSVTVDPDKPEPHLNTPDAAVKVVRAEGDTGDKVAIAAFSVSNFGLFASSEQAVGLFAVGGLRAAEFEGDVKITGAVELTADLHARGNLIIDGDIQLSAADYAEDFSITDAEQPEPGMVMVLDDSGCIRVSTEPYDRRVAGVVSGAGGYRPGIVLDHQTTDTRRRPIALMGKVYCRVDASDEPIAVGDLLTTSRIPGHAMKASSPARAFGAVIGKALGSLETGRGLVPILVALQ